MDGDDDNCKSAKVALLLNLKQLLLINLFHLAVVTRAPCTLHLHMPTPSRFAVLCTSISHIQLNHIKASVQPETTDCHAGPRRAPQDQSLLLILLTFFKFGCDFVTPRLSWMFIRTIVTVQYIFRLCFQSVFN